MPSASTDLERPLAAFRHQHGATYLKRLQGHEPDPRSDFAARAFLFSERYRERLDEAHSTGELSDVAYAAVCAHVARAQLERSYERGRMATTRLTAYEVSVEGETRALGALLGEWSAMHSALQRERTFKAAAPALEEYLEALVTRRAEADHDVDILLRQLAPARHADAGPEGGARPAAEHWLAQTEPLTREATAFTQRTLGVEGRNGLDLLWGALGQDFQGLFARDGRFRRLAADWEPLGLRRLLAARARAGAEHPGPLAAPHVVVLAAPNDVRVSASAYEYGLASELASAEAVGRAVGVVHASEVLPFAERFASAATVARAGGALAVQRLLAPHFLRRGRGLSARESEAVSRVALTYFLLDSRLAAAAVLARPLAGPSALDEAAVLTERALCAPTPRAASALVLRASPGAAFRAKVHGPALAWALRERFDEDWYLNPRASEPLRGAFARAGQLAVETLAEELGTDIARGIQKLAELF